MDWSWWKLAAAHQHHGEDTSTAEDPAGLFGLIWVALIVNNPEYIHANIVLL